MGRVGKYGIRVGMWANRQLLLANTISLLGMAYMAIPFLVFIVVPTKHHFVWGVAVLVAPVAADILKRLTIVLEMGEWCKRPQGARDCNAWNRGGPQRGAGFPSGHTATAAAFWVGAVLLAPSWPMRVTAALAIVAMAWSRLQKGCHTLLQTVGGGVLGAGLAVGFLGRTSLPKN